MKADKDYYVTENSRVTVKIELFRAGNSTSPRLDNVRYGEERIKNKQSVDVSSFLVSGEPWVEANSGGISTFDKPIASESNWWLIPAGTELPSELGVRRDHTGPDGRTHYSLYPAFNMPLTSYRFALASLHNKCSKLEGKK
ncbi:MAG: hypothetical protein RL701_7368 [Pseudomonadota bacterium]